jgi:hypothetical protein
MSLFATSALQKSAVQLLSSAGFTCLQDDATELISLKKWHHLSSNEAWASCGAESLTAFAGSPPGNVASSMSMASLLLDMLAHQANLQPLGIDGSSLLKERANLATKIFAPSMGYTLRGAGKMMRSSDGWVAVNLPRSVDLEMLPALSKGKVEEGNLDQLESWVASTPSSLIMQQACLLGMPIAQVPNKDKKNSFQIPWRITDHGIIKRNTNRKPRIVDFSGLWAGPLCTSLLSRMGAEVTRISGSGRINHSSPIDIAFNQKLESRKNTVIADLRCPRVINELIEDADVIVTSSRLQALQALGIRPKKGSIWLRITAYGTVGSNALRIGFGDDVAASVGAVVWNNEMPTFAADALADPITGLIGALGTTAMLAANRSGVIDISLESSACWAISDEFSSC